MTEYKIADEVWHRVVQIVQEGMLTMTDVADGLRMIHLEESETEPGKLILSSAYKEAYVKMQAALIKEGEMLYKRSRGTAEKSD